MLLLKPSVKISNIAAMKVLVTVAVLLIMLARVNSVPLELVRLVALLCDVFQ